MEYVIEETKTESGTRLVLMTEDVETCFRHIIQSRIKPKTELMVALHWEKYFQHIREKYNSIYKVQLPVPTLHVARHTFCSNMAKSGMNPKTLQKIMGHSDIGVTLNVYAC